MFVFFIPKKCVLSRSDPVSTATLSIMAVSPMHDSNFPWPADHFDLILVMDNVSYRVAGVEVKVNLK